MKNLYPDNKTSGPNDPRNPSSAELVGLFEDILSRGLGLRVRVTGRSMIPFLKGGEVLTIKKVASSTLNIGDLILCKNPSDAPLVHRIIKKKRGPDGLAVFQTKGDALISFDEPVASHGVLGKVCKIERILPSGRMDLMDMESLFRRVTNYLTALFCLLSSKVFFFLNILES